VAIGGYNLSLNPKWSSLVACSTARAKFASNVKDLLMHSNLNGVGKFFLIASELLYIQLFLKTLTGSSPTMKAARVKIRKTSFCC
jgi:uncharacterized membrane protein